MARKAFASHTDRMGRPSILHIERVANRGKTDDEITAGWLHDLIEDTDITLEALEAAGFPPHIVATIDDVSRRPNETYREFIERIARSGRSLSIRLKLNDLHDNRSRCAELPGPEAAGLARRYDKAIARLTPLVI